VGRQPHGRRAAQATRRTGYQAYLAGEVKQAFTQVSQNLWAIMRQFPGFLKLFFLAFSGGFSRATGAPPGGGVGAGMDGSAADSAIISNCYTTK
jgi:hypothetical protein